MAEKKQKKSTKKTSSVKAKAVKKVDVFKLYQISDISQSEKLASELLDHVKENNKEVTIDATDVKRITTPCVQVLISFFVLCKEASIMVSIKNSSDPFIKAFEDLGLIENLNQVTV